jgi:hypothetical protein
MRIRQQTRLAQLQWESCSENRCAHNLHSGLPSLHAVLWTDDVLGKEKFAGAVFCVMSIVHITSIVVQLLLNWALFGKTKSFKLHKALIQITIQSCYWCLHTTGHTYSESIYGVTAETWKIYPTRFSSTTIDIPKTNLYA